MKEERGKKEYTEKQNRRWAKVCKEREEKRKEGGGSKREEKKEIIAKNEGGRGREGILEKGKEKGKFNLGEACRREAEEVVQKLKDIAYSSSSRRVAVRVQALKEILDRGYGKPKETITDTRQPRIIEIIHITGSNQPAEIAGDSRRIAQGKRLLARQGKDIALPEKTPDNSTIDIISTGDTGNPADGQTGEDAADTLDEDEAEE